MSPSPSRKPIEKTPDQPSSGNRPVLAGLCLVCAFLIGCGGSGRPTTIPVTGSVSVNGEAPQYSGALFFAPLEVAEGYPRRGGRALFDLDGRFEATSFEDGDGLVPGKYRVRVESWKQPPAMGKPGISNLPSSFRPPDLVVAETEKSVQYDLALPAK